MLNNEALFNPSIPTNASGVVTGRIGLTKDLKELFKGYATAKVAVYANAGEVTLTDVVHQINGLAQAYTVTVKVLVKSPWGVVVGTEGKTSVEVAIPKGFTY